MTREYRSAVAFKQALEQRIRTKSNSGFDFSRRRQLVVFDRFLARIVTELGDAVTLKGGLAVELRLERARTTKDIDLRLMGPPDQGLVQLRTAARLDLGDFMVFTVRPDDKHPEIQNGGMRYDGMRFRVECRLAGKVYAGPFGVDLAYGDPILGDPEIITASDALDFAGIAPPMLRVYPVETHLAEKLHAYTMPRTRPNSRVKDLPDIALLATTGPIEANQLQAAFNQTFEFRGTHSIPKQLAPPPAIWDAPYTNIAAEDLLQWTTLGDVFEAARAFIDPILAGNSEATWDPSTWSWARGNE